MWSVDENDFETIMAWGVGEDPFASVKDFTWAKVENRGLNPEQAAAIEAYISARNNYIKSKDFDNYYKTAEKPIDKLRWKYLKDRKAWYIIPLNWELIARNGGAVIDLGCGDGDTIQRLADYVSTFWVNNDIEPKDLHIVGIDLNSSRITNARNHVESPHSSIKIEFMQGDAVTEKLPFDDNYFDFSLACGVLEILDDVQFKTYMNELCRVTEYGIYIEDLYEQFPGGYPRQFLGEHFIKRGFSVARKEIIMSEPFSTLRLQDPKRIWPIFLVQILWLEKHP